MLVSVIMGVYNCEDTLNEAILSIVNQTYNEWEFIICDDGSTDNSYTILKKYKELYKDKIILLQNDTNRGLSYTLNKCLKYASGKYIARMDGDDISKPERFKVQVEFLNSNTQYAFVSSGMIHFDKDKVISCTIKNSNPPLSSFARGTPFIHASSMIRKEAYDAVGGYDESVNRIRVEDYDLWIRMYEKGYTGYNLDIPLYMFRDDLNAYKRRKFRYRINESLVSLSAIKKLNLPIYYCLYALRPIIVGLLPKRIYMYLHRKKVNH